MSEQHEADTDGKMLDPAEFRIPTIAELDAMRVDHGLSQKGLSRRAGLESSRFNHILHNDIDPQTSTLRAFLDAIRTTEPVTTTDLAEKRGPKPEPSSLARQLEEAEPEDVGDDPRPEEDRELRTDGGPQVSGIERGDTVTVEVEATVIEVLDDGHVDVNLNDHGGLTLGGTNLVVTAEEIKRPAITDDGTCAGGIEHLYCKVCEGNVTVARYDDGLKLVCHCTHVDGRIEPVDPDSLFQPVMPYGWNFIEEGPGRGKEAF